CHRPPGPRVRPAGDRCRPPRRRAAPPPGVAGLPVDGEAWRGDLRGRRPHRRTAGSAGARVPAGPGPVTGPMGPDLVTAVLEQARTVPDRPAVKDLDRELS